MVTDHDNTAWEPLINENKGPMTKAAFSIGLITFQREAVKQLKRLRRKTKQWRGVSKALELIENLKPENN